MRAERCVHAHVRILVLVLVGTLPAACGAPDRARTLVLTGSSTVAPLAAEIAKRFERRHPDIRVDVQTGGSSRGIADVRRGTADIGMVSRALGAGEEDLLAFPIARDGVCVIVHRDNPVASLTTSQVVGVFTGRIDRWSALGGEDRTITVVTKASGRATLAVFLEHFHLEERDLHAHVVIGDNEQGIKTVAGDPGAIAFVSVGNAEYDAKQGVPIRLLPIDGVEASTATLERGEFPISRPLNLVFREAPGGIARMYLEFARSGEVHDLVRSLGYVPVARGSR